MTSTLETALKFHEMGIAVVPIQYRSKAPDRHALLKTDDWQWGKTRSGRVYKRTMWEPYQTELPSLENIATWFVNSRCGVGVVCGHKNLVVIDFDNMGAFLLWDVVSKGEAFHTTYKVQSSRGMHVYYFVDDLPDQTIKLSVGIDIKASGYVLAPPSIHPSGKQYTVYEDSPIARISSIQDVLPFEVPRIEYKQNVQKPCRGVFDIPTSNDLKSEVQIIDFFPDAYPTGSGWYMDLCPFHEDSHPSFWINTKTNRCGCHKCVNGSLSVIDFYMKWKGLTALEAIQELKA